MASEQKPQSVESSELQTEEGTTTTTSEEVTSTNAPTSERGKILFSPPFSLSNLVSQTTHQRIAIQIPRN